MNEEELEEMTAVESLLRAIEEVADKSESLEEFKEALARIKGEK